MPDVQMPSIFVPDCSTSSACLPPVPNCQPVKVSLTTFMSGLALMASMKPSWRAVSAGAPEMPRISRMFPLPPSFSASHSPPRRPYSFWSLVTLRTSGESIAWSTETIFTSRRLASEMTELSAVASAGLMMIAFAPEEIRLRMAAICSGAAPFWLDTSTFSTLPSASACALTAQIISSRQPLPTNVLETPRVNFSSADPPPEPEPPEPDSSSPQAATPAASAHASSAAVSRLLVWRPIFLLLGVWNRTAQHARDAPCVLGVRAVEQLGRPAGPHDGGTGDDRRQGALREQRLGRPDLELVGQRGSRDGRARPDRGVDALHLHHRVPARRAEVEHHVGVIDQRRLRLRGGDRDHGKPAPARAGRHLDRNRGAAARAEHQHRVGWRQLEVLQDLLREPLHALDEHRLPLAVDSHHLGVERHRELGHRVEPRVRAVPGEQLLDGDPGVPGAEGVDEAAGADRLGADLGRALQRRLLPLDAREQLAGGADEPRAGRGRAHPVTAASSSTGSQRPLPIER